MIHFPSFSKIRGEKLRQKLPIWRSDQDSTGPRPQTPGCNTPELEVGSLSQKWSKNIENGCFWRFVSIVCLKKMSKCSRQRLLGTEVRATYMLNGYIQTRHELCVCGCVLPYFWLFCIFPPHHSSLKKNPSHNLPENLPGSTWTRHSAQKGRATTPSQALRSVINSSLRWPQTWSPLPVINGVISYNPCKWRSIWGIDLHNLLLGGYNPIYDWYWAHLAGGRQEIYQTWHLLGRIKGQIWSGAISVVVPVFYKCWKYHLRISI